MSVLVLLYLTAVVQKPADTQQYVTHAEGQQQIRGRQQRQTKLGKLPRIIGLPLSVVESSGMGCGNRTGEECLNVCKNLSLIYVCSSSVAVDLICGMRKFC
jgi:hypothetical protein